MSFMLLEERHVEGISEFKFAREGNVIRIGQFPVGFSGSVCLTGRGAWRLYMYQGNLVKKRWRQDAAATPYINHPLAVARALAEEGGVTDTKFLGKKTRKCLQPARARRASAAARQIKVADKLCNLRDILTMPPADWSGSLTGCTRVCQRMSGSKVTICDLGKWSWQQGRLIGVRPLLRLAPGAEFPRALRCLRRRF